MIEEEKRTKTKYYIKKDSSGENIPETDRQITSRHPVYVGVLLDAVEMLLVKPSKLAKSYSKRCGIIGIVDRKESDINEGEEDSLPRSTPVRWRNSDPEDC